MIPFGGNKDDFNGGQLAVPYWVAVSIIWSAVWRWAVAAFLISIPLCVLLLVYSKEINSDVVEPFVSSLLAIVSCVAGCCEILFIPYALKIALSKKHFGYSFAITNGRKSSEMHEKGSL